MKTTTSDYARDKKVRGRRPNGEPNPVDIHIGNRLRLRRQILQLSQQQLGKMSGLTFQQVQKYEKGLNRISGSRLWDFACLLGVDVNFFYDDMDDKVFSASLRCVSGGGEFGVSLHDPMQSEQVLNLVKAFSQIKNQRIKDDVYNLIIEIDTSKYLLDKATTA